MALPTLYFEMALPDAYRDLVDGVAIAVGPERDALRAADGAILGAAAPWNATTIDGATRLRVVSRLGVGYDNVDVAAIRARGVEVCYTPEAPMVSTAEHTMALMLAITKRLPAQTARALEGLGGEATARGLELDGTVLGLIGFGRIARRVSRAALGLGMRVLAHDPYAIGEPGVAMVPLETALRDADVVSLHAPAGAETHHLINASTLATMKPTAYLVNCARGSLVDQDALVAALDTGRLAGAALDVTEPEPLPKGHPLLGRDDVIVTPHIASSTAAGRRRLFEHAIANALAVIDGRPATVVP